MPTKWSNTLIPTQRQVPGEAEVPSHQLMLRAGLIRRLGAGVYDYLPLGVRSLHKAMQIVREEMDNAGAVEVLLPALQPIELFDKTGRRDDYGDNLFTLKDRHGREHALGPTHEEVITTLVGACVESYKQLPLTLYQIQTKFRDEFRPRFGVLRSREFQMKDAYSFHIDLESLNETYQRQYDAYGRIFDRCGLACRVVEAESGPIGGSASHEFMVPSPTGEDTILESDRGNYAANVEKCEIGVREHCLDGAPTGELEKVNTPDCATIDDVCRFMKVKPKHMLKTLICQSERGIVIAVVRGDHELNEGKLRTACGCAVGLAEEDLTRQSGFAVGFVGPHAAVGRDDVTLVVDPDAAAAQFWASGANEADHHVKHFNWTREVSSQLDPDRLIVADIRNARSGDPSPKGDGGTLKETTGIEIGHVFKLGSKYSDALGVSVLDEDNQRQSILMGCYGIGINRLLAAAIEQPTGHDERGIIWPASMAPYAVIITPIKYAGAAREAADRLATELEDRGLDVLLDDRDERPGVKFNDADLIGIPIRITIGDKGLKDGKVEVKPRRAEEAELVPLETAADRAAELWRSL